MNEKLNYFQAVGEAVGTERRVRLENGEWLYVNMTVDGGIVLSTVYSEGVIDEEDICRPTVEQKMFGEWIVEPEKLGEIFVWLYTNEKDGKSYVCRFKPKYDLSNPEATIFNQLIIDLNAYDQSKRGVPQKFKLVPVEDDAV